MHAFVTFLTDIERRASAAIAIAVDRGWKATIGNEMIFVCARAMDEFEVSYSLRVFGASYRTSTSLRFLSVSNEIAFYSTRCNSAARHSW